MKAMILEILGHFSVAIFPMKETKVFHSYVLMQHLVQKKSFEGGKKHCSFEARLPG